MRVRVEHWQLILDFCEENTELITSKFNGPNKAKGHVLWQSLTQQLNRLGFGRKSKEEWRKTLVDWKSKTKAKALKIQRCVEETGGGYTPLSDLELRLLAIMGRKATDEDEVPELEFGKSFTADWNVDSETSPAYHLVEQDSESTSLREGSPASLCSRVSSPNGPRKKLKITVIPTKDLQMKKIVGKQENSRAEHTTHNAFGTYIAEQLRSLPPDMVVFCKKVINDAIFEAEMGNLTKYSKIVDILPS